MSFEQTRSSQNMPLMANYDKISFKNKPQE